jgi:hypothetical protein
VLLLLLLLLLLLPVSLLAAMRLMQGQALLHLLLLLLLLGTCSSLMLALRHQRCWLLGVKQRSMTALLMPLIMTSWCNRHYRAAVPPSIQPPLQHIHPTQQPSLLLVPVLLLLQVAAVAPGLAVVVVVVMGLCLRPLQGVGWDQWCLAGCSAVAPSSSSVTRGPSEKWHKVRPSFTTSGHQLCGMSPFLQRIMMQYMQVTTKDR